VRLLVTGAGGMLGQDVVRAARERGWEVSGLAHAELDVTDGDAVAAALAAARVGRGDAIVNCAAWTDVDGAESDPDRAHAVNASGAGHVARAAASCGARLVHVSTDYVFDGEKRTPYVESDPTGPRSVYGRTKLAGEEAIVAASADLSYAIVRSSWLFGLGGRNFVATVLRLGEERDEVTVVADQIGCPTYTGHLAEALLDLAGSGAQGIFHVAGGSEPCSWHAFAVETFRQAGVECHVLPCTTEQFPRPAPRPAYSALASERPETPVLPPWHEGLAAYLQTRKAIHA
jgi:dTDP-4-dehydrorhamnose reductase